MLYTATTKLWLVLQSSQKHGNYKQQPSYSPKMHCCITNWAMYWPWKFSGI